MVNKIAFVMTDWTTWEHLKNIIHALPADSYDIVVCKNESEKACCLRTLARTFVRFTNGRIHVMNKLKLEDFRNIGNVRTMDEVLLSGLRYKCAICVFPESTGWKNGRLKIELIAESLIRASFITGAYSYILCKEINKKFDYILCSGKEQKKAYVQSGIRAEVLDLGNPRLLQPPAYSVEMDPIFQRLDKNKKTILWIPTHGRRKSSVADYLSVFSKLQEDFNVIMSSPPCTIYGDFCFIRWRIKQKIERVVTDRDSASLMPLADFVFCDYGGSPLTAIYYDKNVLLLNSRWRNWIQRELGKSPEVLIRNGIVNFNVTDSYEYFLGILNDDEMWKQQKHIRQRYREKYFSCSSEDAVKKICEFILKLLAN